MNLPEIAIRRPVFAWMLMSALILFGGISASRMGVSQLPDVDFPIVTVRVEYPGAAPEIIETNVVDVIEDAVLTVEGVRSVTSTSRYASASISVEFELSRNISDALQEVQNKVASAQRFLPTDIEPPVISKTNPEDQPILWMSVTSDRHAPREMMRYVKDTLKNQFSSVTGVGEIAFGGYVEPNLRVWLSGQALNRYDLAVTDVLNAIKSEHSELPAGQLVSGGKEYDVRTLGEVKTAREFGHIVINQRGGQPVYSRILLNQVAEIEDGLDDIRRISRANGERAVSIGIRKQRGSNTVAVAHGVKARMAEVAKQLPEGMKIAVNFDTTKFIEDSVDEFKFALVMSALVTALVCWLFLGSWTATLNVILAIPTSIVGTFIVLYAFGFTLNTFTLLGLSLAIGIVVDDAIMVLENIVRHREKGENRVQAALVGSREITFAAVAATLAVVAIFLPVAFMSGVIGEFFFQFGVTMTVAVMLSLLEALTLTPMRASQFVEAGSRTTRIGRAADYTFRSVATLYRKWLAVALAHPWKVIGSSLLFFALSFSTLSFINKELMPVQDQSSFIVRMQTPVDSSMEFTDAKTREAEKFLATRPEIRRYMVAVGGFGGGQSNLANIFVSMKPRGDRGVDPEAGHELSQQELMAVTRQALKNLDLKVSIQDLSQRGFTASRGFPVEFAVQGRDWDKLVEYSETIIEKLNATGLVTDADSDYLLGKPEIQIIPDRARAAERGVSIQAISQTVNAMVGGVIAGQYSSEGHRYDVRVRLREQELNRIDQIKRLYVRNNRGERVPLSEVVQVREGKSLAQINRHDRQRSIKIFANVQAGKSQQDALARAEAIAREVLPPDYKVRFVGSSQSFQESFSSLWFVLILGLIVSYMVLASQFNSFIHPVTVLMALPFSVSGAFLTLLAFGHSLNIFSFIGLILLMGIVKKNSILLVDFTNQVRDRGGIAVRAALLEACPIRLRPILMTSFATIAAALPLALALGPGAELRAPMAIAVIGGVLVSTFLTLFVVPCVYELLARFEHDRGAVEKRQREIADATKDLS